MRTPRPRWFIPVFSAAFFLSACGASPLLHHADEPAAPSKNPSTEVKSGGEFSGAYKSVNTQACASLRWQAGPAANMESVLTLTLSGPNPVTLTTVRLWMPDMGHGAGRPPKIQQLDAQTYLITGLYFIMPGRWDLEIYLSTAEVSDKISVPIKI